MSGQLKSVLIVEDDPDLREMEATILDGAGYRATTAVDGLSALEALAREQFDLVLLDMKMPRMNGWEFAREFRARHGHRIPVVVVTAAEDAQKRAAEVQADGFLGKPFDIDALVGVVESQLAGGGH